MGLLDKAIKSGLNKAIGNAVEQSVTKVVAPKVEQAAANAVNKAADALNQSVGQSAPPAPPTPQPNPTNQAAVNQAANTLGGLFGSLQSAATGFATEAAKNMKICPACGEPASAQTKFCPSCGATLPNETVAAGAVCPSCGKQNDIGTKFCADCGAKLPAAVAEEHAAQARTEATFAQWDTLLPQYPKWQFGGRNFELERLDDYDGAPYYQFFADGAGQAELAQYRQLLLDNGFRPAGQYPDQSQLFKRVDGVVYNVDLEHAFDSDGMTLYFTVREPSGGFDYVKPEKKSQSGGLFDLFR
ncbi:MAG: zinc ribbon domain-containing protein [Christensenellaceae bacterium]|jgi:hypothetical protein|nr:zinc ribbon domain-containing protein [Christensenellaceae bacterium]